MSYLIWNDLKLEEPLKYKRFRERSEQVLKRVRQDQNIPITSPIFIKEIDKFGICRNVMTDFNPNLHPSKCLNFLVIADKAQLEYTKNCLISDLLWEQDNIQMYQACLTGVIKEHRGDPSFTVTKALDFLIHPNKH